MLRTLHRYTAYARSYRTLSFLICLHLLFFITEGVQAQFEEAQFEYLSQEPGVPNAFVHKIFEDSKGFFWFCTTEGLYRYDGYQYRPFMHNVLDERSISHPVVYTVFEDRAGHLWVGTGSGLDRLDRSTWNVDRHVPHPSLVDRGLKERNKVFSVFEDAAGNIWTGTASGIALFDTSAQRFISSAILGAGDTRVTLYKNEVFTLSNGKLVMATNRGLFDYSRADSTFKRILLPPEETEQVHLAIRDILEVEEDRYLLATYRGVLRWDASSGNVTRLPLPDSLQANASKILRGPEGNLWISFAKNGLVVFDPVTGMHHRFVSTVPVDPGRVTSVGPVTMQFDHLGDLWMGRINGIWRLKLRERGIDWFRISDEAFNPANNVRAIGISDQEVVYLATQGGVHRKNGRGSYSNIPFHVASGTFDLLAINFYFDTGGSVWASVATPYAIGIFETNRDFTRFERYDAGDILPKAFISTMQSDLEDPDYVWLGTYYGLGHLNKSTREITWYKPIDDHQELPLNNIKYLVQEDENVLWTYFMGASALGRFDHRTESFEIIRPPAEQAHVLEGTLSSFEMDDSGNIWITSSYGLTRFHIPDQSFTFYTTDNGLAENKLIDAIPDREGNIWVVGTSSITQFRPQEQFYRHFDVTKDLRRLNSAGQISPKGDVYLGGINGYYRINPTTISRDTTPPRIILTDFKVSDKSFGIGVPAEEATEIDISYKENIVTFEFLGLHFLQPDQNKYKCKLEGFDKGRNSYVLDAGTSSVKNLSDNQVDVDGWTFAIDVREDWRQLYTDAWRMERDYFYDPNMHGIDWDAMYRKYLPLVDRVTTRNELSDVIGRFVGELSALHTSVRGGDTRSGDDNIQVADLGARLSRSITQGGYAIDQIYRTDPDYPDERSPLDDPYLGISEGDVITHINGVDALQAPDIGALLRNQQGKQVRIGIRHADGDSRDVIVTPIGNGTSLRYSDWEYSRRQAVEQMSQGKIGYVHLRAMGSRDLAQWYREFYPVFNRPGLIIDVRHNRGGNIESFILEKLMRQAWMYWKSRSGEPYWNMQYAFRGHMVVLVDENTASDGEAFADGFRRLGLGQSIGTRTWGGEIWLSSSNRLSDGGLARAPMSGVYGPEGEWLIEGHGFEPDIVVENLPHATFNGKDAQLEAAITHLMQAIELDPRHVPKPPAYPDKSFH